MYCRNCKKPVREARTVCDFCGENPLRGRRFCYACGTHTSSKDTICNRCGTDLSDFTQKPIREFPVFRKKKKPKPQKVSPVILSFIIMSAIAAILLFGLLIALF